MGKRKVGQRWRILKMDWENNKPKKEINWACDMLNLCCMSALSNFLNKSCSSWSGKLNLPQLRIKINAQNRVSSTVNCELLCVCLLHSYIGGDPPNWYRASVSLIWSMKPCEFCVITMSRINWRTNRLTDGSTSGHGDDILKDLQGKQEWRTPLKALNQIDWY